MNIINIFRYFFDASAIYKLLKEENGSDRVKRAYQNYAADIQTTWLCVAETYGNLKRDFNKPESQEEYLEKIFYLQTLLEPLGKMKIETLGSESNVFFEAEELIKKYHFDFSDAIQFIALKTGLNKILCGDSKPVLVTSDRRIIRAARDQGIEFWDPEKSDPPR